MKKDCQVKGSTFPSTPCIYLYFDVNYSYFLKNKLNLVYPLTRRASIKDILEAIGIPHPEVGSIFKNSEEVDFTYIPQVNDKFNIFYHKLPVDFSQSSRLRPARLGEFKFICDVNVGKLALLLRMLGYDTYYHSFLEDEKIAFWASVEKRIVLTKDINLLKRKQVHFGYLVRAIDPDEQLKEVSKVFGLKPQRVFKRCLLCNALLKPIAKKDIVHLLEPKTKKYFNKFYFCFNCKKIYWPGSHLERMKERLLKSGFTLFE